MQNLLSQTKILLCSFLLLNCFAGQAQSVRHENIYSAEKIKKIEDIIRLSKIAKERLSIFVGASGKGIEKKYFELNGERQMTPASLTKIVTAAAVLESFPVGHQFLTQLRSSGKIENGVLAADICLSGGGDSGFTSESMWFLVNEFLRTDIKKISGKIIVDDTLFDQVRFDKGRDQVRVDRAYDSPIGAMTFNWSVANIFVRPARKVGEAARIWADPENEYIQLDNLAKTVAGAVTTLQVQHMGRGKAGKEKIKVSGTIGLERPEDVFYKAIERPDLWAGYNLKSFLKTRGVEVAGEVIAEKCPEGTRLLAEQKSKSAGDLVLGMMKYSNNYIAEILTKSLGAFTTKKQGTMESGLEQIKKFVTDTGLDKDSMVLRSPSGLSQMNKVSAKSMVHILSYMQMHSKTFPEYIASFPISGVDGTLRKKETLEKNKGRIRAKTGHLSTAAGLAGYVFRTGGEVVPFAMIYNGDLNEGFNAKSLFTKLSEELVE